jgi:hypothetical protein
MRLIQRDLHQQLRAEAIATRERLVPLLRRLDASQINEHPEPQGWSVGQVIEHLLLADDLSRVRMTELLRSARPDAGAPAREWKSTILGGLVANALINPKPARGPKIFRPGPTPRNGVVETLLAGELEFVQAMDDAASYDWRALRVRSPAFPRWAPKFNLGDAFRVHVVHLTRHTKQIERVAGKLTASAAR